MNNKNSFILYLDQQDLFNRLPDEVAGKLIKHIFSYVNCENPESNDMLIDIAFSSIKQSLKRDLKKWESQRKQRSEAGKKSALSRANEKQRALTSVDSRSTKSTVSVSGSVNVSVSEKNKKNTCKTSIPDGFDISDRVKQWAIKNNHSNLNAHLESFKLSCESKNYKYVNWDSAFMKAIRDNWAGINNKENNQQWELGTR